MRVILIGLICSGTLFAQRRTATTQEKAATEQREKEFNQVVAANVFQIAAGGLLAAHSGKQNNPDGQLQAGLSIIQALSNIIQATLTRALSEKLSEEELEDLLYQINKTLRSARRATLAQLVRRSRELLEAKPSP